MRDESGSGSFSDDPAERWQTLGTKVVYSNAWCALRMDEVRLPSGETIEYGTLEAAGFSAIVPVTDSGSVVLVRQYRQPIGDFSLELPGGGVDPGEDPAAAAGRELSEETGYRAEELEHLSSVHTTIGRSDEVCHLYRCRAVPLENPHPEPQEFLRVVELPIAEALALVGTEISAATTVLGLLWVRDMAAPPS